ncbi:MAG: 1-acyl-sn-glycerol-3-phosphate acyltransferase [Candidatus Tectomicrobia bacterium]|nr:1-acyl-sn-glycerol-3-phosphate acyltransferase [Candidatus Tectomicrobia bacterium]
MMQRGLTFSGKILIFVVRLLADVFFHLLNRTLVMGEEYLPKRKGVVIVSNHVSYLDPLLVGTILFSRIPHEMIYSPAKAELFTLPLFGSILIRVGGFPVKRNGRDLRAMKMMEELMKEGRVLIFPEGTRHDDGKLGEGKRALGRLIYQTRPLVIPAALFGTGEVLPKGKFIPRFFLNMAVRFGPPLDLESYFQMEKGKETYEMLTKAVMEGIGKLLEQNPLREGNSEEVKELWKA